MSRPAALPETPADRLRPLVERQLAMLGRLAEAGLEIAIALEAQAKGGASVVEGDLGMAYARVSRAVRQTIMLQSKLIDDLRGREKAEADRRATVRASAARIIRDVIDHDRANDLERIERLRAEAAERLEHEDFADLDARPFGFVVAEICKGLGLNPDWLRLAQTCAAAGPGAVTAAEDAPGGQPGRAVNDADDAEVRTFWIDPNSPPGETRYYDPWERREERRQARMREAQARPPPLAGEGDPEGVERA